MIHTRSLISAIAIKLLLFPVLDTSGFIPGFCAFTCKKKMLENHSFYSSPSLMMAVTRCVTEHTLYYVPSVAAIDYDGVGIRPDTSEVVPSWDLSNDKGTRIRAMARGANMVALNITDTKYVWENIEGAVYYGAQSNNFPYTRGLSLNGGVRFAAVTAEHGLYYDSDWDYSESDQLTVDGKDSKSIIFTIVDTDAAREFASNMIPEKMTDIAKPENALPKGFSRGAFSRFDHPSVPMSKYPTTNMEFKFNITLVDDEDFVRLRMSVKNYDDIGKDAEAWVPMTFPIDEKSKILSRQKMRWRRDEWCFPDTPNLIPWDDYSKFHTALDWPTGGIFYDFPKKDGRFHGVVTDSTIGSGVVYVCPDEEEKKGLPHFTKMWSWGNKENFIKGGGSALTQGRPASEYYEPWSSGSNFAFFNSAKFDPKTELTWDVAILPIQSGLKDKSLAEMLDYVDSEIDKRPGLVELTGVKKKKM